MLTKITTTKLHFLLICVTSTFALQCYNGCGLASEIADYCKQKANAYLVVNSQTYGAVQICPKGATVCANTRIINDAQFESFTIKGCDTKENCEARRDLQRNNYFLDGIGKIKFSECCETDLCNSATGIILSPFLLFAPLIFLLRF